MTAFSISSIGETVAARPTTASVLNKFEPMILPKAKSFSPLRAAAIELASSGSDVPMATIVRPISKSLTPSVRAIATAPHTKARELATSNSNPKTSHKMDLPRDFSEGVAEDSPCEAEARGRPSPFPVLAFFISRRILNAIVTAKTASKSIPFQRTTLPSHTKIIERIETTSKLGRSPRITERCINIGEIKAVAPRISAMFAMLLP